MRRLNDKVVLLTGGASGLGKDQVFGCVKEGAKVIFADVQDAAGAELEAQIRANGGDGSFVHLDVSSEQEWQAAIREVLSRFGTLDVLVYNAGGVIKRV